MKLKDQTALITGSSRGIGEAIARAFAAEGAQIVITGRSAQDLETLKKEFNGMGVRCESIVADLLKRGLSNKYGRKRRKRSGTSTSL